MTEEPEQEEEEEEKTFVEMVDEIVEERDDVRDWGIVWTNETGEPLMAWKVTDSWGGASSISIAAHSLFKTVIRKRHRGVAHSVGSVYEALQEDISETLSRVERIENYLDDMDNEEGE